MINRIIAEYIKGHKRLVVPGFGAFIRKDTGEVVLVEFLKKNDGVLIALIAEKKGISEQEAIDATEQYIAKVKRNVSQTGDYHIEGLGKVYVTPNGFYELEYIAPVEEIPDEIITAPKMQFQDQTIANTIGQEIPRQTAPETRVPAQEVTPKVAPKPAVAYVAENRYAPNAQPARDAQTVNTVNPTASAQSVNQTRPSIASQTVNPTKPYTAPQTTASQVRPSATSQTANPARPYSNPVQPAQQAQPARPAYMRPSHQPQPQKKADMVMIIAIAAAIIALAAIFFSSQVNGSTASQIAPVEQVSGTNNDNL